MKLSQVSFLLVSILLLASCSTELPDYHEAPQDQYNYYSGGKLYGNHYCKVQKFTQEETGKTITLIGMIHIADQSFYDQVDDELDEVDVVLEEGIHGLPSFGINKYFGLYTFDIIDRLTKAQGLVSQNRALKTRDNAKSADMSIKQFKAQGGLFTPLFQLISLPIMAVFTEPSYIYYWSKNKLLAIVDEELLKESEAQIRHDSLIAIDSTQEPAKVLMPGIIDARNVFLVDKAMEYLKKGDVNSIAIPWGAAHMPGVETLLLEKGFTKSDTGKWLRSIAVDEYLQTDETFTSIDSSGIPYVMMVDSYKDYFSASFLFSSIKTISTKSYERTTTLWGDLTDYIKTSKGSYFSLLPKIAGKPLLFDIFNGNESTKVRFLWFFSLGSLDSTE